MEMVLTIKEALEAAGLYKTPHVFVRSEVDRVLATQLREIVKRHHGIVENEQTELTTHIIFPLPENEAKDELVRPVLNREMGVMLHWLFTPDSYDTWHHNLTYDSDVEPAPTPPQQWRVDARWLLDMDEYNEWMNEEDYALLLPGVSSYP